MSRYKNSYWGDENDHVSEYDNYGGYGYGYGSKVKKENKYSSYTWSPSVWTNYSWGYGAEVEDDNSQLFVKDPVTYLTPTKADIKTKANVWLEKSQTTIKELSRVCYLKMVDDRDYVSEMFSDTSSMSEGQLADHDNKMALYDSIFEKFIPGNTPLEQAIAIYRQISNTSEYADPSRQGEDDLDFESTLDFDRAIYADANINEQLNFNELSKNRKMDILNKISIVGNLGDEFKVEKETSEKLVSNSDQYAKKIMRDYAQFSQIELYQKMFPNFRTKFLTKDLTVNVPVDRKEQKQKIIILLDYSGSMDEDSKQIWVNAILIDRLKYVMKEEAEVFFSYFIHNPKNLQFHHLKNKQDVMDFWGWFSNHPNGGTTDIGAMVTSISKDIAKGYLGNLAVDLSVEKPEILIINDGQDRVGYDTLPYKVNAISLMEFSDELKNLCVKTGGKQVQVTYSDTVTSYSEQGITVVSDGKKK
jgi:hypothetical protein